MKKDSIGILKRALIACVLVGILVVTIDYIYYKININSYGLLNNDEINVTIQVDENADITLDELFNIQWEMVYVFPPYSSAEEIREKIGIDYYPHNNYISYRFFKNDIGMNDDSVNKFIFMKNGKIISEFNWDIKLKDNINSKYYPTDSINDLLITSN